MRTELDIVLKSQKPDVTSRHVITFLLWTLILF